MKKLQYLFVLCILTVSQSSIAQELTQMQQVVSAHDEIMNKMPELVKLIGQLQPKADATAAGQEYHFAIDKLKSSNKSMMIWMQGFGERFTADEMMKGKALTQEKQVWILEEQKKIKAISKEIKASMKHATELLAK